MTAVIPTSANVYAQGTSTHTERVEIPVIQTRDPTDQDTHYPVGKRWINTLTNDVFSLQSFSYSNLTATANWYSLSTALFSLDSANTATLSSGTVSVSDSATLTTSNVLVARLAISGFSPSSPVSTWANSISTGSFAISSSNSGDDSEMMYIIVN